PILQPDSITDQMLYSKIASSPELRANITTFMRARGYVSDADLESYVASGNVDDMFSSLQGSQIPGRPLAADRLPSNTLPNNEQPPSTSVSGGIAPYATARRPIVPRA